MGVRSTLRRLGRAALAGVAVLAMLAPAVTPALAADPVLPRPTATVRFLEGISFSGTVTLPGTVPRLEIVVDIEGSTASFVADVSRSARIGTVDLEYVLATPGGAIMPGTDLSARFRATLEDGSSIDGPGVSVRYEDTRYNWRSLSGEVVTVHWVEGGTAFGRRALRIAEAAVAEVAALLGVIETDPIDFYIYADREAFYNVLGPAFRENVGGVALPEIRTLLANIGPDAIDDPWVGVVIPHELTHLVFDTAIRNPYHDPPRWLNEGLAVYLSESYGPGDRGLVEDAIATRRLMPLRALVGQFPTTEEQFRLAYAESVSAVDVLVRRYGEAAMVRLVRSYADGVTDDEAFRAALGTDVAGFEAAWLDAIAAPEPTAFGPLDAPPGPFPSDWLSSAPAPGEIPGDTEPPGPTASASPGTPEAPGGSDGAGLLSGLVAAALVLAGVAVWLARRNRIAARPAADAGSSADAGVRDEGSP